MTNANREKYLEKVKHLRLIDDIFFNICFDDNIKCMNLLGFMEENGMAL